MPVEWYGKEIERELHKKLTDQLKKATFVLQSDWRKELSKPGGGPTHRGSYYPASTKGKPPAVQTGHLRNSIQTDTSKINSLKTAVGSNLDYAKYLEYGTQYIAARPHARTTLKKFAKKYVNIFKDLF